MRWTGGVARGVLSVSDGETPESDAARRSGRPPGQVSENALASPVGQRYLAAKRSRPEGDV